MKKVISALVAFVAISASAATYVTVTDCNGGETGTECRKVTYQVRPATPASAAQADVELYPMGEGSYGAGPKVTGGWLLKLLQGLGNKSNSNAKSWEQQQQMEQYRN